MAKMDSLYHTEVEEEEGEEEMMVFS